MPAKSKAQLRFMAMIATNPKVAKSKGIPQAVGVDFVKATKLAKKLPEKVKKRG